MTARSYSRGHPICWDGSVWRIEETNELLYTAEMAGSGQYARCIECGLLPTPEGHDGCLGTLDESVVMNACCGHGRYTSAYIQYRDKSCVRGLEALKIVKRLKGEEQ